MDNHHSMCLGGAVCFTVLDLHLQLAACSKWVRPDGNKSWFCQNEDHLNGLDMYLTLKRKAQ